MSIPNAYSLVVTSLSLINKKVRARCDLIGFVLFNNATFAGVTEYANDMFLAAYLTKIIVYTHD